MSDIVDGVSSLRGWEVYPENLAYRGGELYGYSFGSYRQQIQSDAERLFTPDAENIVVKIIEFNPGGEYLHCVPGVLD